MNLTTLLTVIGLVALVFTAIIVLALKKHKNILTSFLQNFCGVLFIFSGWVKVVDPLGTAYKMEQYFTEFESTFSESGLSFLAPIFPILSEYALVFSVVMIIFEIVLGIMLVLGIKPKLTAWLFLLLVAFFTVLTGFTYTTGYVPNGVNYFNFSEWGPYVSSNMKVTDCGCFGDFIKLKPFTTFMKDVALMVPAIYFIFAHKSFHRLVGKVLDWPVIAISTIGLLIYAMSNYAWNIPHMDFRPFNVGKDVAKTHQIESDAMANVKITHWLLQNKQTGKSKKLENQEYMSNYKQYPKSEWKVVDQIKTEPTVKSTKISEFEVTDLDGNDISYKFLEESGAKFLIVSYKLYAEANAKNVMVKDTTFVSDTIVTDGIPQIVSTIDTIVDRKVVQYDFKWDQKFADNVKKLASVINPLAKDNEVIYAVGGAGVEEINALAKDFGLNNVQMGQADDILLKTIVRSNPGVVLWKDGRIIDKWHINKLPSAEAIRNAYLK